MVKIEFHEPRGRLADFLHFHWILYLFYTEDNGVHMDHNGLQRFNPIESKLKILLL